MTCEKCANYSFYEMITSGKPYGYSGTISCFACSRYFDVQDKFVLAESKDPILPQKILKLDWKHILDLEHVDATSFARAIDLKRKQDEIIDVINDMRSDTPIADQKSVKWNKLNADIDVQQTSPKGGGIDEDRK